MLMRMSSCGQSSFSKDTTSKLSNDPVTSGRRSDDKSALTSVGHNVLIALFARTIGSLGFGLSILVIWLRWLVPVQSAPSTPPVIRSKAKSRRRSLPSTIHSSSHNAVTHVIIPVAASSNLFTRKYNHRTRHVYFAEVPHHEIVPATKQSTVSSHPSVDKSQAQDIPLPEPTPSTSVIAANTVSTPTTPASVLSFEDISGHQMESTRQRTRSSNLIAKIPCAFHSRNKRASLPATLTDEVSHTCTEKKKKLSRPFTPPWISTPLAISSDIETFPSQVAKSSFSLISFQPRFSRTPSVDASPCNQKHRSSLFTRKAPRRSNTTPIPRTLPYEAPYCVSPPIPIEKIQTTPEPKHI